jgi:hypothetical protein
MGTNRHKSTQTRADGLSRRFTIPKIRRPSGRRFRKSSRAQIDSEGVVHTRLTARMSARHLKVHFENASGY